MLDVNDVLLCRPAAAGAGFHVPARPRPPRGHRQSPASLITAAVYPVHTPAAEEDLLDFLHSRADPILTEVGRRPLAELRTEPSANSFPALPVREGEHVVVRFARYPSEQEHAAYLERLRQRRLWREEIERQLTARLAGPPQRLRLQPTPRSALR
jgi:hypothetical protein